MISTGLKYECITNSIFGYNHGDLAEVIQLDIINDTVKIKRLKCLSTSHITIDKFSNAFVVYDSFTSLYGIDNYLPTSTANDFSFDEQLGKGLASRCECGAEKVYGTMAAFGFHSSYCPKSQNDTKSK